MNFAADAAVRKPRVLMLAGYLYLSNPIYIAIKKQLRCFDVVYYFSKDIIGADINHDSDEYRAISFDGESCIQLKYSPKWFHATRAGWYERGFLRKIITLFKIMLDLKKYRKLVINDIEKLKPDVVLCTSDIFYTSRLVRNSLQNIPFFILQPSYLDLTERNVKYRTFKLFANLFFKGVFNCQPYFGLELQSASLLVWDEASYKYYSSRRQKVYRVINPAHVALRDQAQLCDINEKNSMMCNLGLDISKKTLIIYTGHFETLYGENFQRNFERMCIDVASKANESYNVIVKVHPNAKQEYWAEIFASVKLSGIYINRDINKDNLLSIGDVTLATNSYASVEAAIAGLITINFYPVDNFYGAENFVEMNSCYSCKAHSAEDVIQFLDELHDFKYFDECAVAQTKKVANIYLDIANSRSIEELMLLSLRDSSHTA